MKNKISRLDLNFPKFGFCLANSKFSLFSGGQNPISVVDFLNIFSAFHLENYMWQKSDIIQFRRISFAIF